MDTKDGLVKDSRRSGPDQAPWKDEDARFDMSVLYCTCGTELCPLVHAPRLRKLCGNTAMRTRTNLFRRVPKVPMGNGTTTPYLCPCMKGRFAPNPFADFVALSFCVPHVVLCASQSWPATFLIWVNTQLCGFPVSPSEEQRHLPPPGTRPRTYLSRQRIL